MKDGQANTLLGSIGVRVQEFLPDRMKVVAKLSSEVVDGWVSPTELKATVNAQNLFGTPATARRVEATLTLQPAFPAFRPQSRSSRASAFLRTLFSVKAARQTSASARSPNGRASGRQSSLGFGFP